MSVYRTELNQTDPDDSPTPGLGHYAGEVGPFRTKRAAFEAGERAVGKPVPEGNFHPCCDWQRQETLVTSFLVVDVEGNPIELAPDASGEEVAAWLG